MNELAALNTIIQLQDYLKNTTAITTDMQEFTDHFFAPGIYLRTLFIPKDFVLVGHYHKYSILNILLKGKISVMTSKGEQIIAEAPYIFTAPPGKKAGYAITNVWYAGVFPNPDNITDIKQLEKIHIMPEQEILSCLQ